MCDTVKKMVSYLMCAEVVVNAANYDSVLDAYRKVCKFMASKLGTSPQDLPALLKQKLDALTEKILSYTKIIMNHEVVLNHF